MDQKQKKSGFSYQVLLLNLFICFACVILFHLIAAFALLKIPHFNSYFSICSWIVLALSTLAIAALQKKSLPLWMYAISWGIFSLLLFFLGVLINGKEFDFFPSFLRCTLQFVLTLLFAILFRLFAGKKHPRNKKFNFSK